MFDGELVCDHYQQNLEVYKYLIFDTILFNKDIVAELSYTERLE
jgi:hypothetical protein